MIQLVTRGQAIEKARFTLGLPDLSGDQLLDEPMLAASVRRVATYTCPCSAATLKSTLRDALVGLTNISDDDLETRLDLAIEGLQASGDLLELSQVTSGELQTKGTWLFCAPPSFVSLKESGRLFLIGMSQDEVTPLPQALQERVQHEGYVRLLRFESGEELALRLRDLGWRELTTDTWLRQPKCEDATAFKSTMDTKLSAVDSTEPIADLRILDRQSPRQRYKDLWVSPVDRSGTFVCRRPQEYGSDMWGYAHLAHGFIQRLLNFPLKHSLDRGCDTAWRLQLAIDAVNGAPQTYRVRRDSGGVYMDIFGPLPLWAQRRLANTGRTVPPTGSLLSYQIEETAILETENFMQRHVWMTPESSI